MIETKPQRGRKPKLSPDDRTLDLLRGLGRIHCTEKEAAAALGVSLNTLKGFFTAHPEAREEYDDGKQEGFVSLRRTQFKMAERNAAMAIWLGKQYLGQKDRAEVDQNINDKRPVRDLPTSELLAEARRLLSERDSGAGGAGAGEDGLADVRQLN
jgi:hypothetical protein